jgi:predicted nucleotidyltransferase
MYPWTGTYVPVDRYKPFFGGSNVRRRILQLFLLQPGKRSHVRQVARELGTVASAVGRELRRLEEAGVLTSEVVGRARVYRLDETSAVARDAAALFSRTEGIEPLLRQALVRVPGIERAWLFGSHVERTERPDSDLDVMVVGTPGQAALSEVLVPLEDRFGRAIHTTTLSADEFQRRSERPGFIAEVLRRPRIDLIGGDA